MKSITVDVTQNYIIINGDKIHYENKELFAEDCEAYLAWWIQTNAEQLAAALTKYEQPNYQTQARPGEVGVCCTPKS